MKGRRKGGKDDSNATNQISVGRGGNKEKIVLLVGIIAVVTNKKTTFENPCHFN